MLTIYFCSAQLQIAKGPFIYKVTGGGEFSLLETFSSWPPKDIKFFWMTPQLCPPQKKSVLPNGTIFSFNTTMHGIQIQTLDLSFFI